MRLCIKIVFSIRTIDKSTSYLSLVSEFSIFSSKYSHEIEEEVEEEFRTIFYSLHPHTDLLSHFLLIKSVWKREIEIVKGNVLLSIKKVVEKILERDKG